MTYQQATAEALYWNTEREAKPSDDVKVVVEGPEAGQWSLLDLTDASEAGLAYEAPGLDGY